MIFWNETRSLNLLFAMTTATDRTQLNSSIGGTKNVYNWNFSDKQYRIFESKKRILATSTKASLFEDSGANII